MTKGIFDQSIENMLELDKSLDINSVLESIPAIEPETKPEEKEETPETKKVAKEPQLDINKVLDETIKESGKKVDDEVDELEEMAPATNEQPTKETSDAPFTVIFAKDLVQQGLISSFDESEFVKQTKELGEATALRNLIKGEIDQNLEAAKEDLEAGYKEYLNLIGKGVPVDTAGSLVDLKNQFEGIKSDDLAKEENVELRKRVMTDYFKLTTSMSQAKIDKLVQSSIDLGDDVEDSKEYLTTLKSAIKEQIQAEEAEAERQAALRADENKRTLESLKETINSLDDVIPGVAINKQTRVKMYEDLTKEVQDGKGRLTNPLWAKRAEDPIFFDSKLAYLLETGFFEKGKPWTKASASKTTKEVSELEKVLSSKKNTTSSIGSPVILNIEQEKTAKDNIDSMRGIFGK